MADKSPRPPSRLSRQRTPTFRRPSERTRWSATDGRSRRCWGARRTSGGIPSVHCQHFSAASNVMPRGLAARSAPVGSAISTRRCCAAISDCARANWHRRNGADPLRRRSSAVSFHAFGSFGLIDPIHHAAGRESPPRELARVLRVLTAQGLVQSRGRIAQRDANPGTTQITNSSSCATSGCMWPALRRSSPRGIDAPAPRTRRSREAKSTATGGLGVARSATCPRSTVAWSARTACLTRWLPDPRRGGCRGSTLATTSAIAPSIWSWSNT